MEVGPEWAKCCCCKLSVSKSSGRLKWCADDEKWKSSKCLKLMISIIIVFLPVAVVCLSILKFSHYSQKQGNYVIPETEHTAAFDMSDIIDGSRQNHIRDLHTTNCIPTTKGNSYRYSARVKRDAVILNINTNTPNSDIDIKEIKQPTRTQNETKIKKLELINKVQKLNYSSVLEKIVWTTQNGKEATREAQAKIMKHYMDEKANPCDDFYQYACGNWETSNPIPEDRSNLDTFEKLRESLHFIIKDLLEEERPNEDILAYKKVKDFYKSCNNYEILEKRGITPLLELLNKLGDWPLITSHWNSSAFDWIELMARLRTYNNDILVSVWIGPDIKNSNEYVIQFDQTSLGLPTRDHFLQPSYKVYLEAYKKYLIKTAKLLGGNLESIEEQADEVITFETNLAMIVSSQEERRNVTGLYQRMTVQHLQCQVPQIVWKRYLTILLNRTSSDSEQVVVFAMNYLKNLVRLVRKTPPRAVANYLLWRFIRHRVNNLDDRFQESKQEFYFTLIGREKSPPRWKHCVTQANTNMGMAVGAMFVQKYFDENSKNDTLSMTKEIQNAFGDILNDINWLGNKTKTMAAEKVNSIILKVGYPNYILTENKLNEKYKDVEIHPERYFENTLNLLLHVTRLEQSYLGTTVNKSIWNTAPAVVNAYYSRNKNQILFPAGILQPPFYHKHFPRSLNFGGIGVVIGHEITHGFDDKGRQFDKNGNLHKWWEEADIRNFHKKAQCIIDQYSKYIVEDVGMSLDGINTQGENIADNGGIKQAYKAYEKWLSIHGNKDEKLPGLNVTERQLFFINFAQIWCGHTRPEASKNGLKTSVHSPGRFRVIGTLSNNEEFSQAFQCPLGSPMNPLQKCILW